MLLSSHTPSPSFGTDRTSRRKKTQSQQGLVDGCVPLNVKVFLVFEFIESCTVVVQFVCGYYSVITNKLHCKTEEPMMGSLLSG